MSLEEEFAEYPEVIKFARLMLTKLKKNEFKQEPEKPWPDVNERGRRTWCRPASYNFLKMKLQEEREEFDQEIYSREPGHNLALEAADEANILMMLVDNRGLLK